MSKSGKTRRRSTAAKFDHQEAIEVQTPSEHSSPSSSPLGSIVEKALSGRCDGKTLQAKLELLYQVRADLEGSLEDVETDIGTCESALNLLVDDSDSLTSN